MPDFQNRTSIDWQARFEADDAPWERPGVHPALAHWLEAGALAPGLSVYVPGCGRGLEPKALAQAGLAVTASDYAPSAAAFQRDKLAPFSTADIFEADSLDWRPGAPFDRLYEQTFLCAIHPHDRPAYEKMAFEVLKPGGQLLALFMQKDERGGPPYGCSIPAMKTLFTEDRWVWPEAESFAPFPHPGLNGKPELAGRLTRR
jgi:SAM-dependent methyltransferase